jgi:hypothetical protein
MTTTSQTTKPAIIPSVKHFDSCPGIHLKDEYCEALGTILATVKCQLQGGDEAAMWTDLFFTRSSCGILLFFSDICHQRYVANGSRRTPNFKRYSLFLVILVFIRFFVIIK